MSGADNLPDHLSGVIQTCLHCGMCLPVCPTYDLTMDETSSPRGRIRLMDAVRQGTLGTRGTFAAEMNFCLDCQACESACPAGVRYGELLGDARERIGREGAEPAGVRLKKFVLLRLIFGSAGRFALFSRMLRFYRRSGLREAVERSGLLNLMPASVRRLVRALPNVAARSFTSTYRSPATVADARGSVGLLTGCVMDESFPGIHRDTVHVLEVNGVHPVIPGPQFCCGALHAHNGDTARARAMAREIIGLFPDHLDAIVVNSAGCGAFMKDYGSLLQGDTGVARRAAEFSSRVRDVNEYIVSAGYRTPRDGPRARITYHDPCHLVHAQGISSAPREILRSISSLDYVELPGADVCCGSAGIYNILRPDESGEFLWRKIDRIRSTGADLLSTANPGCHLHIARGLEETGSAIEVVHPITMLSRAYRHGGQDPPARKR